MHGSPWTVSDADPGKFSSTQDDCDLLFGRKETCNAYVGHFVESTMMLQMLDHGLPIDRTLQDKPLQGQPASPPAAGPDVLTAVRQCLCLEAAAEA